MSRSTGRGPIFETWVASEIAKDRANQGEVKGISHYRDRNGAEADLIVERPGGITIVEAKASTTASSSLFHGSSRVRQHLVSSVLRCSTLVFYGGDQSQHRRMGRLLAWKDLHAFDWGEPDCIEPVGTTG